ncbi:hypothetical protein M9H77_12322 [Catharanthus roseus]|uniref:Uncharacterized protein n=1 Tax=Catharanthus roseus TaxID=4058 RepID=A0ACC0BH71_CATRO|nr:hypothetical protein M9H77_12322 [Catharanthus roseus]
MKATLTVVTFLLFSISTCSFFCSAAEEADAVLDIDGKKVRAGVEYYVLPVIRGSGGGLTASSFNNQTLCPLSVVQEQLEVERGQPVTFRPENPKKGVIRVSTDVNIRFRSAFTICIQSNVWKLEYDEETGRYIIVTNGVEGNPGRETISNWFKIEKYERDYKLVYCPTVCNYCKVICKDVGTFIKDGNRRLALTDDKPFRVMFKKA